METLGKPEASNPEPQTSLDLTGEVCHQVCAPGYVNTTAEVDYVCNTAYQTGVQHNIGAIIGHN